VGILTIRRRLTPALLCQALALAPGLPGQRASGVELGAFGAITSFSPRFDLRAGLGAGGRVGYFVSPVWSLEIEAAAQRADVEGGGHTVPVTLVGIQVLHDFGRSRPAWYAVGGYARPQFRGTPPGRFVDDAVALGVGRRAFVGARLAIRGDFRGLYTFSSGRAPGRGAGHLLLTMGLSWFTIGARSPDADGDGIPDGRDACPHTPPSATVDRQGCPADSDADGILDGRDQCPNSPSGALVDARGCPVDADGDGVFDGIDQCPGTSPGTAVDARGCPLDGDGDGVDDTQDQCPDTPAGTAVDRSGCPVGRDADSDGVDDARDRCPDTPTGTPVDAVGCRLLFRTEHDSLVLEGVTFEAGRSRLQPGSADVLDAVAASLLAHPEVRIEIAGYTDNTGSAAVNTRLAAARAEAVRAYLMRRGVSPGRMIAKGYGPANPVASNATPEGRAQNRRVELHRL
jgi:outer membrane protein OmpA-like peptidoglycan-associated protein